MRYYYCYISHKDCDVMVVSRDSGKISVVCGVSLGSPRGHGSANSLPTPQHRQRPNLRISVHIANHRTTFMEEGDCDTTMLRFQKTRHRYGPRRNCRGVRHIISSTAAGWALWAALYDIKREITMTEESKDVPGIAGDEARGGESGTITANLAYSPRARRPLALFPN
ncbi:hypothetical protein J6590_006473 [Homalodisca vitripennis]|nr:hypothetical protein J6590_006473 [Homalodisca vitripennis]